MDVRYIRRRQEQRDQRLGKQSLREEEQKMLEEERKNIAEEMAKFITDSRYTRFQFLIKTKIDELTTQLLYNVNRSTDQAVSDAFIKGQIIALDLILHMPETFLTKDVENDDTH